jgi:hypothetical protein
VRNAPKEADFLHCQYLLDFWLQMLSPYHETEPRTEKGSQVNFDQNTWEN